MRLDDATLRTLLGRKAGLAADLLEAQATLEEVRNNLEAAGDIRHRAARLRGGGQ